MTMAPLACSVRDCGASLTRRGRTWSCARGHSHDIGRSGYVNLLQPQDRRSAEAGDSRDAVDARRRLLDRGLGRHLIAAVVTRVETLIAPGTSPVLAELGCGTGHLLQALCERLPLTAVGIDLSRGAVDLAARRWPGAQWVVANADRRLPLLDHRVDLLLSVNARRNPSEAARVLTPDGALLIAIPAEDDLIELRTAMHGQGTARDRVEPLVAAHAAAFTLIERWTIREQLMLDADGLRDLLTSTYRGARHSSADRVHALDRLTVTFASDAVLLRRR